MTGWWVYQIQQMNFVLSNPLWNCVAQGTNNDEFSLHHVQPTSIVSNFLYTTYELSLRTYELFFGNYKLLDRNC